MRRIAYVTGSTGFLGLNLVEALTAREWDVVALRVEGADERFLSRYRPRIAVGNLNDRDSIARSMPEAVDAVFHLAANTSTWARNDAQQVRDNVEGTRNVVEVALAKGARRFVQTSSISAFGHHPGLRIDESTPSNALRRGKGYHRTKYLAELIVKDAVARGLHSVILNPCNILGPYDVNNWTRQFIRPVYDGSLFGIPPGRAMWCHVKDVADAHIAAVDKGTPGRNYLLGGEESSFLEIVREIERQLGKEPSRRVLSPALLRLAVVLGGVGSFFTGREPALTPERYMRAVGTILCDYSAAQRDLGYRTSPVSSMIADTLAWLRAEKIL